MIELFSLARKLGMPPSHLRHQVTYREMKEMIAFDEQYPRSEDPRFWLRHLDYLFASLKCVVVAALGQKSKPEDHLCYNWNRIDGKDDGGSSPISSGGMITDPDMIKTELEKFAEFSRKETERKKSVKRKRMEHA